MLQMNIFLALFAFALSTAQSLQHRGPYLLWGPTEVETMEMAALQAASDTKLSKLYRAAEKIELFLINTTGEGTFKFPALKSETALRNESFVYLPQLKIPKLPNNNIHIISLSGSKSYENSIIEKVIRQSKDSSETANILRIIGFLDDFESRKKREIEEPTSTMATATNPTDEPMQEDFIYRANGKAILYTSSAPVLILESNNTTDDQPTIVKELKQHGIVTVDEREQFWRLSVTFSISGAKTTLRFKFPISMGYWYLSSVEIVDKDFNGDLMVVGETPSAPIGFSYKCSRQLVFKFNNSASLVLENVQVQPLLAGADRFSDAYDCIGFTTVPIWSGIFVSFFILFGTSIGIIALMDIKTPSKFESSRSKQLTFTVQE